MMKNHTIAAIAEQDSERYAVLFKAGNETRQAIGLLSRASVETRLAEYGLVADTPAWAAAFEGEAIAADGTEVRFIRLPDEEE